MKGCYYSLCGNSLLTVQAVHFDIIVMVKVTIFINHMFRM